MRTAHEAGLTVNLKKTANQMWACEVLSSDRSVVVGRYDETDPSIAVIRACEIAISTRK